MAFDLKSARPVSSGFDLSSARLINQPKLSPLTESYFQTSNAPLGPQVTPFANPKSLPKGVTTEEIKKRRRVNNYYEPEDFIPSNNIDRNNAVLTNPTPGNIPLDQSTIDTLIDFENDEGFLDRAASYARQGMANLNSGPSRVRAALNEFDANNPLPWTSAENTDRADAIADAARRAARQEEVIANQPIAGKVGLEEIVANPLDLTQYPEGLVNLAANSLPYMVGAKYAPALTTAALAGSLGQQRAQNNGRQDANLQDIALAAPAATVSMAAERLGIEGILGAAGANAATRVAKAGIGEGLSEVASSSAEYAGGSLGTERGYDPVEAARQAAYGFLGGSFMGAGFRGIYEVGAKAAGVSQNKRPPNPPPPPAAAAGKPAAPPPPPPAPAPVELAQKLGTVGSKIILKEPGGVNTYTYRGMDEGGRVIIEAEDGSIFAEDPAEISEAIDIGAVVPTEPAETSVPGVAFGEPVSDEADALAAKIDARDADINARLDAEEAKLKVAGEEALRLKTEAENKPVSQPTPEPGLADVSEEPAPTPAPSKPEGKFTVTLPPAPTPAPSKPEGKFTVTLPPAPTESIAPPEPKTFPVDKEVASYMDEYARFRTDDQMDQIMARATEIARENGKRSISKDTLFKAAMEFDDQMAAKGRPAPVPAVTSGPEITDDPVQTASNVYAHLLSKGTAKLSDMVKPSQWEGQIRELADNPSRYHAVKDDPTTGFKIGDRVTIKSEPDAEAYVVTTMNNNGKPIIGLADDTGYGGFVSPEEISHYDGGKGRPAPVPTKSEQDLQPELERIMGKFHPQLREKFMLPQLQEKIASGEPFTVDDIPDALRRNISQDDRVLVARALSKNPQQVIDAANSVSFKTPAGDVVYPTAAQAEAAPAPAAPRAVGKAARATIPATREKVDVQYELQDMDNIKFAKDELQNRDRSRPASDAFITDFVNDFDPDGVGEHPETDRGAPVINKDNVILSGNGRTMGLQEIYDFHPDKAEIYKESLREQGYDIEGIERPVLVRRLMSGVDERKFVTSSNEPDVAALSPPEQAAQDASDILTPGVFAKFNGGDLNAAKNDAFVSAFLGELSSQQRKNYMDDKGKVSAQAIKRIENALLYKAYGGSGRASKIFISKAMERSSDDTKTLTNSLIDVSKDWIKFQQAVKDGEVDKKYDITDKLMQVVGTVSDIKTSNTKISDALRSPDMIEEMDPFVKDILLSFHDNNFRILSRKAIAEKLKAFTEVAANQQPEPDMFGKAETPSARDIWKRVDDGEGVQQPELYQSIEGTSTNLAGNPTSADIMRLAQGLPPAQRVNVRASLDKILNRFDKNGSVNRLIFDLEVLLDAVNARIERDREKRSRDRVRGFERAMEVIYRAEREGKLKSKSADLIRWLLQKNPRIADDLAISITSGIDQPSAGDYGSAGRLARIFYSNASEGTAVHEVLHHTERMMPQKVRDGIRAAWSKRIKDLIAIAENTNNTDMREVLGTIVKAYYGDNVARKELSKSYEAGTIPYSMYHLSNPSEFWAVNATKLVGKRAEQTGWLGAARKWLGDFIEKVKDIFGFTNNSAIIKGLDAVLAQESGVMRGGMLGEGARRARRAARYGDVKGSDGEPKVTSMREVRDERLRKSLEKEIGEFNERLDGLSNAMDKESELLPQMQVSIKKTLQAVYNKLDDLYITAPTDLEPALDDIEERIFELQKKLEAGLPKVANQNVEVPLTELEKAEAEYNAANEKHMDFFYNMDDERQFVDRRFKARKEYEKELDQLEQAHRAARDKWEKLYQKETERLSETMLKGSMKDVKKAISNAQKPDNLIMDERAYLQKKNRGCD